jgi:protein-S-isoprenylcysteine O-methyltransferase Ste14
MGVLINLFYKGWLRFFIADITLIWGAYFFYSINIYYNTLLSGKTLFALLCVSVFYSCGSFFSIIQNRKNSNYKSKGFIFWKTIFSVLRYLGTKNQQKPVTFFSDNHKKTLFLFTLVKIFFIPIMIQFVINNYNDCVFEISRIQSYVYNSSWLQTLNNVVYPLAVTCFFLIDTALYTFGYLFESSLLKNRIRSVESTWLGWMSALLCYPPLNELFSKIAPQQSSTYAYFGTTELTFVARLVMMGLVFIYVFASISLGAKCSNLTNRGIVTKGAYSIVRHPAYIAKVLFWWITIIPLMIPNPFVIVAMLAWTMIYFIRAVTEERHLSSDNDYIKYCSLVKYRFIPFIY